MAGTTRRTLLAGLGAAPLTPVSTFAAWPRVGHANAAQSTWPHRRVQVIVPYPPGGATDTTARILFAKLSENLGHVFYIENRSGASGTIGESIVARSAHDGYTVLHDSTAFSVNGSLYQKLHLDYGRDFVPVFLVSQAPAILVVTPSAPVKTVAELISLAKSSPHGINMASGGFGSLSHLCLEIFRHKAGVTVHHVPYRGGAQAINDLMSGHVKYCFGSAVTATGLIKAGKLRGLAHTWKGPLAELPGIPPISDTFPGFEALDWNGVFVRHGTPETVVHKLNAGLNTALAAPQVSARYAQLNIQSHQNSADDFNAFVRNQMTYWGGVVKDLNIKAG